MSKSKKSFPIHRTRIGDIIAEFAVPPTKRLRKKGRVAIIAKGVPGMPSGNSFLEFLARQGFYAILPRYRGTWESGGVFLKKEPTEDIKDVLGAIAKPLTSLYENKKYTFPKNSKVYLFVGSFGGPAGILLSKDIRITKVFAYAPVVDWRIDSKMEPLSTFIEVARNIYGEAYRTPKNSWKKLAKGKFYNPAMNLEKIDGSKVHIFHAKDDEVVAYVPVERFAKHVGAQMTVFKKGGHGGASSFMEPRAWKQVLHTLQKKK